MAYSIPPSDFAKTYPLHQDYIKAAHKKIHEFMCAQDESGMTNFMHLICHDLHFPGVFALPADSPALLSNNKIALLQPNLSEVRDGCSECLALFVTTYGAAQAEAFVIPDFATSHKEETQYANAVANYADKLHPVSDARQLTALVNQIQSNIHFAAAVAAYPPLLQFMSPIKDASLIISALSCFVPFMQSKLQNHDQVQQLEARAADDDDTDSDDEMPVSKKIQFALEKFYCRVAVKHAVNPDVLAAVLEAYKACEDRLTVNRIHFYSVVANLAAANDPNCNRNISIGILLVNFFPSHFFSLHDDIKVDMDFVCSVLPHYPFLFFLLAEHIQKDERVIQIVTSKGVAAFVKSKAQPSMDTLRKMEELLELFHGSFCRWAIYTVCKVFFKNNRLESALHMFQQVIVAAEIFYNTIVTVHDTLDPQASTTAAIWEKIELIYKQVYCNTSTDVKIHIAQLETRYALS